MKVDYLGNKAMTMTLQSGVGLHLFPKQKGVQISEQDYFFTKKLKSMHRMFKVIQYDEEDRTDLPNKIHKEDIQADKPVPKYEQQGMKVETDDMGRPVLDKDKKAVTRELTAEEKKNKIGRKHTRVAPDASYRRVKRNANGEIVPR